MHRHNAMGVGSAHALTTQTKDINVGNEDNEAPETPEDYKAAGQQTTGTIVSGLWSVVRGL